MTSGTFDIQEKTDPKAWIYYALLILFAISLPASITASTIIQVLFAVHWLITGNYREKLMRFFSNKPVLLLCSVFLVYLTGMMWTDDLHNGFGKELLNKLPILTLPFFIASEKQVNKGVVNFLPVFFSLSVLVITLIGSIRYFVFDLQDPRALSPYINHIHFGNMVVLSIFWLPWSVLRIGVQKIWVYFAILISAWLLGFIFLMATLTAWLGFITILIFLGIKWLGSGKFNSSRKIALVLSATGLVMILGLFLYILKPLLANNEYPLQQNDQFTQSGNPYHHDFERMDRENGYLVFRYISDQELEQAWNSRSEIPFDSLDKGQNEIRYTLYRFMASKGLKKDKEGFGQITDQEVSMIELGVPNHLYIEWPSLVIRIHQTFWELQRYFLSGDPRGHSIAQRLELWKAAWAAFREAPVFGWGTGDLQEAMESGLVKIGTTMENYMKPHNQFLYLLLMTGLAGMVTVMSLLVLYIRRSFAYKHLLMKIALILFCVTMFSHTVLDYQMSLGFLLFCLMYFGEMNKWDGTADNFRIFNSKDQ